MVQLIAQTLGVVMGGAIVHRLSVRAGVKAGFPASVAVAVVAFLGVLSVPLFRDGWHALNAQRASARGLTAKDARATCAGNTGVDTYFVGWVEARIPEHARYQLRVAPSIARVAGEFCIRMLLLPRLEVDDLDDAGYVVFWRDAPPSLLSEVRRRGATLTTYAAGYVLARLP